ncbi:MAG: DUF4214 domain-containing protein [Telmatospirillum sp.]|nr:DUF4214 domain-containing protein [Telmatospirillum sp.]
MNYKNILYFIFIFTALMVIFYRLFISYGEAQMFANSNILNFVNYQNVARHAQGWSSNLCAEGVQTSATVNSVIGWQSAALPTSSTPWMGGNNVVLLDGTRANYGVQIDGTGQLMIKDIGAGDINNGQSIIVTGASYAIFNGGATASPGVYSQMIMIQKGDDATLARMYESSFGRMPDPVGYESWKAQLDSGQMSLQKIGQSFVQSSEFQSLFGVNSSDQQFVDALYVNVLGRAADKAGEAGYTAYLGSIEPIMGMAAARASLLVALAGSSEEISHSSSWLIDPTKGGYADNAVLMPAQTVLNQAGSTINLTLAAAPENIIYSPDAVINSWGHVTSGSEINPANGNIPASLMTYNSNQIIIAGNSIPDVTAYGSNVTIYGSSFNGGAIVVNSTSDEIIVGSGATSIGFSSYNHANDRPLSIAGFKLNLDSYNNIISDISASSSGSMTNNYVILNASAGSHFVGASLTFNTSMLNGGGHPNYILELGGVGRGTSAEVAQAINTVYVLSHNASEHFTVIGQVTQTSSIANAGDTIVYSYFNIGSGGVYQNADLSGTGLVTASDLTLEAKLVGVATASLTHANFGSGL